MWKAIEGWGLRLGCFALGGLASKNFKADVQMSMHVMCAQSDRSNTHRMLKLC